MFCAKCGNQMQDSEKFCSQCGAPVSSNTVPTNLSYQLGSNLSKQQPRANGLQIAGMVLGILNLVCVIFEPILGLAFGIAGIICSILGNKKCKHTIGIVGLVCSITAVAFTVFLLSWLFFIEIPRMLSEPSELDRLYEQWTQDYELNP